MSSSKNCPLVFELGLMCCARATTTYVCSPLEHSIIDYGEGKWKLSYQCMITEFDIPIEADCSFETEKPMKSAAGCCIQSSSSVKYNVTLSCAREGRVCEKDAVYVKYNHSLYIDDFSNATWTFNGSTIPIDYRNNRNG